MKDEVMNIRLCWVAEGLVERIRQMLEVDRGEFSRRSACRFIADHPCSVIPSHATLMRRPAPIMARAAHLFSHSAVGLMASAPMISELATSSARPDGFPLRIDQIDIGLEDRDLVGRTD